MELVVVVVVLGVVVLLVKVGVLECVVVAG